MKKFDSIKRINSLTESCTRQRFNEIIDDVEVSNVCKRIYLAIVEYRAAKTEETRKLIKNEQINFSSAPCFLTSIFVLLYVRGQNSDDDVQEICAHKVFSFL